MGFLKFTATQRLLPGRVAGEVVGLEIDLTEATRSRSQRKNVHRACSGNTETVVEETDTEWQLAFEPVTGQAQARLNEFLASTADGSAFLIWMYGTESAPRRLQRTDQGYSAEPFLRTGGGPGVDPISPRITAIEAV